jgi:hypothetical protein
MTSNRRQAGKDVDRNVYQFSQHGKIKALNIIIYLVFFLKIYANNWGGITPFGGRPLVVPFVFLLGIFVCLYLINNLIFRLNNVDCVSNQNGSLTIYSS